MYVSEYLHIHNTRIHMAFSGLNLLGSAFLWGLSSLGQIQYYLHPRRPPMRSNTEHDLNETRDNKDLGCRVKREITKI